MNNLLIRILVIYVLSVLSFTVLSQETIRKNNFQPEEGLAGKDVQWITTPQILVEKMLELAKITPEDFLIDLGSGDGRLVITAAKSGTKAFGIEYNPELVKLSKRNAEKEGVANLARFIEADLYKYDFSEATVISMFLLPEINMKLRPKLLKMKSGTRIVSNTFTMQEWQFDQVTKTGDESTIWNTAYLWIIPAKVEGKWILSHGGELILKQEFQMIKGSVVTGNNKFSISDGRLLGNKITFSAGGTVYTGVVDGEKMEGTLTVNGGTKKWSASR